MIRYAPLLGLGAFCLFGAILLFQMANAPSPSVRLVQYGEGYLQRDLESGKLVIHQTAKNAIVNVTTPSIANAIYSKGIKVVGDHPESKTLIRIQTGESTVFTGKLKGSGGAFPNIEARGKVIVINSNGVLVRPSAFFDLGSLQQSSTLDPKLSESLATPAAVFITGSPNFPLPDHSLEAADAVELVVKGKRYALAIRKPEGSQSRGSAVEIPVLGSGTRDGAVPSVAEDGGK